jgi:hypothetical protein
MYPPAEPTTKATAKKPLPFLDSIVHADNMYNFSLMQQIMLLAAACV